MPIITPVRGDLVQRKCACGGTPGPRGECEECRKKRVQRKATNPEVGTRNDSEEVPPIVYEVLRSPGQPLNAATRAFMEPRFGHDFSDVRVHTDSNAAESAGAVRAMAFTVGRHIVFGAGQYAPHSAVGMRLLAHELTHVAQQDGNAGHATDRLAVGEPEDRAERQADMAARTIAEPHQAAITQRSAVKIARQEASANSQATGPAVSGTTSRPVFFCSKPVAVDQSHAFFRVGGSGPGNPTFELEHDEYGEHCPCGIQGWPTRDYPEDRDSTDAHCVPAPMISEGCLLSNWSTYPVGKYCALGPNSNTYARFVAESCGARGLRPPGRIPGFDDAPPRTGTANPALDARITFLPGACGTIDCDDDTCRRIYF